MYWIVPNLWLIPVLPLVAAAVSALLLKRQSRLSSGLAIASMAAATVLSCVALAFSIAHPAAREFRNFRWFDVGNGWVELGWVLDPMTAVMLLMVSFVGLLIFIYSLGYMGHDENRTRFFCFLSFFAAAMLGVVIANSLLLLFICWELVGLTSFLLIGFWYHKPAAVAAARKAFITTRLGDLALLIGMVWLYSETGTLTFYRDGAGCLEGKALTTMLVKGSVFGLAVSTVVGLLIFAGAVGKSGQIPLHVWLPDAMEGPTPVSALIHAATMVAAGVFLVARMYPLMGASLEGPFSLTLRVVTWVGVLTAIFAASIAVAQTDIKRILAYSTVSQLGFMMMGLGTGGVAVGMFHLITHAFFKALLFMGAGSVIHGCHEEQDIRKMGGLRKLMPVTFATYAVGMMALSGVPLFFSGFWSKDGILHAAHAWSPSHWPFYLGLAAALLTAFYMTRQVIYVFLGQSRAKVRTDAHESPRVMTVPLVALAVFAVLLGFIGTPAWPWFQAFLSGTHAEVRLAELVAPGVLSLLITSAVVVFSGIGLGWWLYGRRPLDDSTDALEQLRPDLFGLLRNKYFIDELYDLGVVRPVLAFCRGCAALERHIWSGAVTVTEYAVLAFSWLNRLIDEYVVNRGFDRSCRSLAESGGLLSRWHDGRVQHYLRALSLAFAVLTLLLIWGCRAL